MNVAIVTLYGKDNIGNRLQHFALQEAIQSVCKNKGLNDIETISYIYDMPNSNPAKNMCKTVIKRLLRLAGVKKYRKISIINQVRYEKRAKRFVVFTDKYIVNKQKIVIGKPIDNVDGVSAAIVGSDQVWHHWGFSEKELEYFYLDFLPPEKRISYAASFGFSAIPEEDYDVHCRGLKNVRFLSCREKSMIGLIRQVADREATLVLDPTLLIETSRWIEIEKSPDVVLPERYILVYYLGEKTEHYTRMIDYLCNKHRCEIVDIYEPQSDYYFTTPDEFLYLIRNAEYVVTDSFHGTVFSILNHKKFWVVKRTEQYMEDMFDRIDSLLNTFNIREAVFENVDYAENGCFEPLGIDYDKVEQILSDKRKASKEFLANSILKCMDRG